MSERVDEDDSLDGVEHALLRGDGARLADGAPADRATARLVVQRFAARERRQRLLIAGGSSLALAAAVALVVGLKRQVEAEPAASLAVADPQSSLVVESGRVTLAGGAQIAPGSPVAAETLAALAPRTCLRAGSNVRLCTQVGAKLRLPRLGEAWQVELSEGAVTAELEAMPSGFSLHTLHGSAAVEGTLFSMVLDPSRAFTTVMVERGRVRVTNRKLGEQAVLLVGQSARLGERFEPAGVRQATSDAAIATPQRPSAPTPSSSAKSHSAAELLEEARQLRGAGRYSQAARLYRRLVQQHPESAEARASLVSLGQLELGQLGQPEAALRSFRAYLVGSGQLRQEAEHGAIQALQRLGRKDEERRAIEAFLARYPKSTQAGALAQRLKQL